MKISRYHKLNIFQVYIQQAHTGKRDFLVAQEKIPLNPVQYVFQVKQNHGKPLIS